jgi:hypothetical protein
MRLYRTGSIAALLVLLSGTVTAAPPAVVELFTSQGCSSCPPADALLGELARRDDVIALAFHVDYWDRLGWRDPFALPLAADRQRRYARALGSAVFTPQAIVGGQRSAVGSDRTRLLDAIAKTPAALSIELDVRAGSLSIVLPARRSAAPYDVNLAAYRSAAATRVDHGENGGQTLTEFNIVRDFRHLGEWRGNAAQWRVAVASLPTDADYAVVLLQRPRQGAIDGAAVILLR